MSLLSLCRFCLSGGTALRHALCLAIILSLAMLAAPAQAQPMGTLIKMNYEGFGEVYIDLFDGLVPTTANNFKQYINTDRLDNTIIHRVDNPLGVIQGGGFSTEFAGIATFSPIALEYNRANTRGTIAMARTSALNSATSQFFINTDDNTFDLGQANNGGYAVFGWVVGPGMNVVDAIADVNIFNFATSPQDPTPFRQTPLVGYTQEDFDAGTDPRPYAVRLTSVEVVREHDAYQNPFLKGDVDNSGALATRDLLDIIDELNANGVYTFESPFAGGKYFDVSGDGRFSTRDLADVVTELVLQAEAQSQAVPAVGMSGADMTLAMPMAEGFTVVPEPSTWVLGATALLAIGGLAARRRNRSLRGRR